MSIFCKDSAADIFAKIHYYFKNKGKKSKYFVRKEVVLEKNLKSATNMGKGDFCRR